MNNQFDPTFLKVAQKFLLSKTLNEEQIVELYAIIKVIIEHDEWQQIKNYRHHNGHNRGEHILNVTFHAYLKSSRNLHCDITKTVIGAMLHDFFPYDWKDASSYPYKNVTTTKVRFLNKHAFKHSEIALQHAIKHFPELVDDKVADIILRHMWPLTITRPKYPESWIVSWADKKDALEIFKNPRELFIYLGINIKTKTKQ